MSDFLSWVIKMVAEKMQTRTQRALEMALKAIEAVNKIEEKLKTDEIGPRFRTRAENGAMLISTLGIVPSLSFFYSKVGKSMYEEIAKIYDGKVDVSKLNMEMLIKDGKIAKEEIAYGLYLRFVLSFLYEEGVLQSDEPMKVFEELSNSDPIKVFLASKTLEPFLIECKKLASAMYKEERT